jgi:beta-lactamase class C
MSLSVDKNKALIALSESDAGRFWKDEFETLAEPERIGRAIRERLTRLAAALIAASSSPVTATAVPDVATIRGVVDAAIRPIMAEHKVPGMAVAVTVDGRIFCFNYGVASRETNEPVSEATIFELGSVSKTFTATLASYAQALGKMSLADHPSKYMPRLKGAAVDKATLLNLGTYTAGGLPLQFPDGVSDDEGMISYFRNWTPGADPGVQREYSNPSIGLFGYVTSLALQRDFADEVETEFLPKLGLRHTYIRVPVSAIADYAWGYDKQNRPVRVNPGVFDAEAYGVKSTAADMIRFVQVNMDTSGLEAPMRRAIDGTHVGYFEVDGMVQGLGWEQYPYPVALERLLEGNSEPRIFNPNPAKRVRGQPAGPRLFNKTGSTGGFGAYVAFVPEKRIGVVMLANRSYPIPDRVRAAYVILSRLATSTK